MIVKEVMKGDVSPVAMFSSFFGVFSEKDAGFTEKNFSAGFLHASKPLGVVGAWWISWLVDILISWMVGGYLGWWISWYLSWLVDISSA